MLRRLLLAVLAALVGTLAFGAAARADVVINELRASGTSANDDFVELLNRGSAPVDMSGWRLDARAGNDSVAGSVMLPAQTIAPRGTLLVTAPGYSLGALAAGDDAFAGEVPAGGSIALVDGANTTQDGVRFAAGTVYGEGGPLGAFAGGGQYAFVRKANRAGTGDGYGLPSDTGDNAADFALVVPEGATASAGSALPSIEGVPGPENLASAPIANGALQITRLDPAAGANATPNREIADPDGGGPLPQTLYLRRTVTNISGVPLAAVGFRVTAITTARSDPAAGQAILRLDSSDNSTVAGKPIAPVSLQRSLQTPLTNGGGLNAFVSVGSITGAAPLAPGASVNVEFALRIAQAGAFQVILNTEAREVNHPPTDIALSDSSVAENQPSGTTVGTLSTTDPDPNDTHSYSLVTGTGDTDNAAFQIVGNQLQTNQSFDFEAKNSYSIRMRSTDDGAPAGSTEKQFTITITNANDAPTDIGLSPQSVDENRPAGTTVGTFSTTDQDAGDTFAYALVAGAGSSDNGAFQIVGSTLQTNQSFNFEAKSSYSIRVRSTDSANQSTEKVFTVTINDVNEAPTDIALSNASVAENQPSGTSVGTFSTTDPDAGDTFTYALVSGTGSGDNGAFQITGSTLQTNQSFDFEAKNSYSIRVRSTDSANHSTEKQFTITITNVNDAPTDIALSSASVAENQPSGTTVGTFSTTDQDAGDTFTYTLVSGTGSTDNGAFQITGNTLKTNQSFNFEAKSSYSIRVRSTDSGNQSTEKQFTITITNVNDGPTDIALSKANVDENQPSGTTVGTFSTTDEDAGDTFTYSLVAGTGSTDNGAFQITGNTLKTNQSFNFEAKSSYSIRVRSTDSGNQNTEKQFTITINDINDPPVPGGDSASAVGNTLLAWGGTASVPAGQAGKDVTTGNVLSNDTDEDAGQTLSMDLAGSSTTTPNGGTVAWFSDGSFRYTPAVNFIGTDTLTYKVTDGTASVAGTVTVTVANKVWYVKNNQAAGGNGRSTEPFDTLVEAQTASGTGDTIYVFKGDGTTTGQNAGIVLKANQRLLGEAVALVVGSDTLFAGNAVNRPAVSGNPGVKLATGSRVEAVDLAGSGGPAICAGTAAPCSAAAAANGSTVTNVNLTGNAGGFNLAGGTGTFALSSFSVTTSGGTGLLATNAGTLSVPSPPTTTIASTGGPAVDIQSTGGSVVLDSATSTNSPGDGINLDSNSTGTFSAAAGSITGAAGIDVDINAGNGDVTYAGTLGNGSGATADITGRTGGAITLSGNITDTNDAGGGITMSGNTGGSTTFSGTTKTINTGASAAFSSTGSGHTINLTGGGLGITTTSGNGLSATGGGTINVTTGTNPNTIGTTTGTALNVASTNIGASGLTFQSISAGAGTSAGAGPANGIVLNGTGSSGGLTVTGDGTNTSVGGNSTGGTITNTTGANATTAGIGAYLNNTAGVVLRRMTFNGTNQNYAIRGLGVSGATLEYSTISGTNGNAASLPSPENYGEGAVFFGNATTNGTTGNVTLTNNSITGGRARDFSLVNTAAGMTNLTVKGNTFGGMQNFSDGNQCVAVEARVSSGVVINTTFGGANPGEGNTINNCVSDNANFTGQGNTTMDVAFRNNTLSNNNPNNIIGGGNLVLATKGTMTTHVTNNTMRDANGSAVTLFKASADPGGSAPSLSSFFTNNTIGVAGTVDSGSKSGNGIFVSAGGTGTMSYTIQNNAIHQIHGNAHIYADNTGGSYTANFTITGNTLDGAQPPNWFAGIAVTNGSPTSSDTVNVCAKIGGSAATEKNALNLAGNLGIIVGSSGAASGHPFVLPGLTTSTEAGVESFLQNNNTGSFTSDAYNDAPAGFGAFTGTGTTCPTPTS